MVIEINLEDLRKELIYACYLSNDKRRKDCLSYIKSFSQNAEQLSSGNKPLTLKKLQEIYTK